MSLIFFFFKLFYSFNNRIILSSTQNILNSYFFKISYSDQGGAISIINTSLSLFISNCMFFECFTTQKGGGAIYIDCKTIKIEKSCGYGCFGSNPSDYSLNLGQFSSIKIQSNQFCEFFLNSIAFCSPIVGNNKGSPFFIEFGFQKISNINTSLNQVYIRSAGFCRNPQNVTMIYSTISSNFASYVESIVFLGGI